MGSNGKQWEVAAVSSPTTDLVEVVLYGLDHDEQQLGPRVGGGVQVAEGARRASPQRLDEILVVRTERHRRQAEDLPRREPRAAAPPFVAAPSAAGSAAPAAAATACG